MVASEVLLFAPRASADFAAKIAAFMGVAISPLEEREFEDGEHKVRPLCSVRDRRTFVVQSLYGEPGTSPNDKLCRLLFLIAALRDAGARRVAAVIPYLAYARKDQRTQPRDPVTSRYVAQLLEAAGSDAVVTLDVHNRSAFHNAFRVPVVNLETAGVFADYLAKWLERRKACVVSPDLGGVKRAQALRDRLSSLTGRDIGTAFMEKYRARGEVSGDTLVGDVRGADVVICDDLISTGTTLARTALACHRASAQRVCAVAAHGLFTGDAEGTLERAHLDHLAITDTVAPFRLGKDFVDRRLRTVSVAPLFADAIKRLQDGRSLTELLGQAY